jgi:hypothetical protein
MLTTTDDEFTDRFAFDVSQKYVELVEVNDFEFWIHHQHHHIIRCWRCASARPFAIARPGRPIGAAFLLVFTGTHVSSLFKRMMESIQYYDILGRYKKQRKVCSLLLLMLLMLLSLLLFLLLSLILEPIKKQLL